MLYLGTRPLGRAICGRGIAGELPEPGIAATFAEDGKDTFVFRDGLNRVQTVRYTLQHRS